MTNWCIGGFAIVAFFYFGFTIAKKATTTKLSSPFYFFFCCCRLLHCSKTKTEKGDVNLLPSSSLQQNKQKKASQQ
jgi:hypothetical protein